LSKDIGADIKLSKQESREIPVRLRSSFETKVLTAFAAAMLVVAALAISTRILATDATNAARWVAHSHEVLNSLARARGDALQIELTTQNYRLHGNEALLAERDATIADREIMLRQIRQLTADSPRQQARWIQLRAVIDERIAISRRTEQLRKTQGIEAASAYVASAPLKETRERMYRVLGAMEQEGRQLLESRNAEQLRAQQVFIAADTAAALLLGALLAASYIMIRRQLQETEASRRALAENEENLATTLHSIGDAVLATDAGGRITRMNPVAERLTGWRHADASGRPVDEVFHIINEHTRAPATVPVSQVLATGEAQELANHTVLIARNGRECSIADSAAPIRDAKGRISGVVLVFRDETVARQAQRTIREQNELLEQRVHERTAQLHESEEHLRSVIGNVPAMIAFVDAQQRYVYVNQQYRQRFAPGREDIAGCTVCEILGEERYAVAAPLIDKVLQGQAQSYDWQPFPGVWQAINYVPKRDAAERVVGYYVLGTDITERKHAEEKIQSLNTELGQHLRELGHVSRALKTLSAGNRAMLRATDEQELLDSMCRAIVEAGGYRMASVWYCVHDEYKSLRPMAASGHPGGLDALNRMKGSWGDNEYGRGAVATAIRTDRTSVVRNILTDPAYAPWRPFLPGYACGVAGPLRVGGEIIGSLVIYAGEPDSFGADEAALLTESADDLAFGIATLRARAEQQRIQEAMHRLTFYDGLTGLPNETQFTELLVGAIDAGNRLGQAFAVLQVNIERLREINDALGFNHGDHILREFGTRLRAAVPADATVARLRGDEFAILLPGSDTAAAIGMARQLEAVLAVPYPVAGLSLDVSAKMGIALFPQHGVTPHDLFRHMDITVNQAKIEGVSYAIFNPARSHGQSGRLTMVGELRRAIAGGDLLLYLQPKVKIATGRLCGAEGLVRWQHAERGLIHPVEFIDLAEQTGLIKPLTEWVIETALQLNRTWERDGRALPIAVNLSARNLRDENLLETICKKQSALGVTPGLLELEITESMVMDDPDFALRVLYGLRNEGIPLYIDDFGTGYSSLSYLQKLPVEYIKIDRSFVHAMLSSKDSAVIVRSTIDLAHDLGCKVVAEGVETQAEWDQLAGFGCDIAQGYFIAKPMPPEEFQNWIAQFRAPVTTAGMNGHT
jgi:diguanylate cyclase (GGDEF)-like protein/PAS domain S-box-containing protein